MTEDFMVKLEELLEVTREPWWNELREVDVRFLERNYKETLEDIRFNKREDDLIFSYRDLLIKAFKEEYEDLKLSITNPAQYRIEQFWKYDDHDDDDDWIHL